MDTNHDGLLVGKGRKSVIPLPDKGGNFIKSGFDGKMRRKTKEIRVKKVQR